MTEFYQSLTVRLAALLEGERDMIANLANASALLNEELPDLNWVGFYLRRGAELVLGPFQGNPACVTIPWGRGVCGTAAAKDETQLVPDVHRFPGHIACDSASRSEIVVPLHRDGEVVGVLDIDSPVPGRFTPADREGLEALVVLMEGRPERVFPAEISL
jgi:GAF domain-containing protein